MIVEIIEYRGTTILIDGKRPNTGDEGWSCGETEDGYGQTVSYNRQPLPFDAFGLKAYRFDVKADEMQGWEADAVNPKTVTLETTNGTIVCQVTNVVAGNDEPIDEDDEDSDCGVPVTLANGEIKLLDETMLYVRAEG